MNGSNSFKKLIMLNMLDRWAKHLSTNLFKIFIYKIK